MSGAIKYVWWNVLGELERGEGLLPLTKYLAITKPTVFGPMLPLYLDVATLRAKYESLPKGLQVSIGRELTPHAFLFTQDRSTWDMLRSIEQHGSWVKLHEMLRSVGV